jgi:hypothetical protein
VRPHPRLGTAVAAWSAVFAVPHVYWGTGGGAGIEATLGSIPTDPGFVALGTWGVAAGCVAGVVYGLALGLGWSIFPRRLLLVGGAVVGIVLLLHGAQDVVQYGLLLLGVTRIRDDAAFWVHVRTQLFVWGPWFLLGGALLVAAAFSLRRHV